MADPIAPIVAAVPAVRPVPPAFDGTPSGVGFADTLRGLVAEVAEAQRAAEEAAKSYATGKSTDVTATMISMERASVTLNLMLQVRNRLLEAYQEIQRLPV